MDCAFDPQGSQAPWIDTMLAPSWREPESGDLLLDEARQQQQQQQRIDAYEEVDLQVRTEPPPPPPSY